VFSRKLKSFFWVILEVNRVFALLKLFSRATHECHSLISLVLPAVSVAFNRFSLSNRFANDVNISEVTLAVYSYLCFTFNLRTLFSRMALLLASVVAYFANLVAGLATTVLH